MKKVTGWIVLDENKEPLDLQIYKNRYDSNRLKREYSHHVLYGDKYISDTKKLRSVPCTITYSPNKKVK